jgi:hypothetical protein
MLDDMLGWVAVVMSAVHLILFLRAKESFLTEWAKESRRRTRRVERYRSLKLWGLEWTAYDREDDTQS